MDITYVLILKSDVIKQSSMAGNRIIFSRDRTKTSGI